MELARDFRFATAAFSPAEVANKARACREGFKITLQLISATIPDAGTAFNNSGRIYLSPAAPQRSAATATSHFL
jgi:hypothetical protein